MDAETIYVGDNTATAVTKLDYAEAPSLTFATPTIAGDVDLTDNPQSFTLFNAGNETLTFVTPSSGTNAGFTGSSGSFTLDATTTTCPEITTAGTATGSPD
jgi:hypothetical protein